MISLPRSIGGRLILGFGLAAVAQFLGLFIAGAGHGWVLPLFASMSLWVLAPATLAIGQPHDREAQLSLLAVAVVALGADIWLISATIAQASDLKAYLAHGAFAWAFVGLWFLFWISWQTVLISDLLSCRKADA